MGLNVSPVYAIDHVFYRYHLPDKSIVSYDPMGLNKLINEKIYSNYSYRDIGKSSFYLKSRHKSLATNYYIFGFDCYQKKDYEEALVYAKYSIMEDSLLQNSRFMEALCYVELEMPDSAIKAYDKMLEIDPFDASVYKAKGNSLRKKGLYDLAEQSFLEAIKLDTCYYEAYSQLGFNYCDAGLIDKAKELIEKMKAHDNRNVTTHYIGILLEYIEKF